MIVLVQVMDRQKCDIMLPLPKRRDLNGNYIEPVKEILPKPAFRNHLFQQLIRRRDQTHIYLDRSLTAKFFYFSFLEDPEQLGLHG